MTRSRLKQAVQQGQVGLVSYNCVDQNQHVDPASCFVAASQVESVTSGHTEGNSPVCLLYGCLSLLLSVHSCSHRSLLTSILKRMKTHLMKSIVLMRRRRTRLRR